MAKTFPKETIIERVPTAIGVVEVVATDAIAHVNFPDGQQTVEFRLSVIDQGGHVMGWISDKLEDHLDTKTFDDFMKATEKLRKKAEQEILP